MGRLLHELGYRLQSVRKSRECASHPDRNAQFEYINSKADEFLQRAQPEVGKLNSIKLPSEPANPTGANILPYFRSYTRKSVTANHQNVHSTGNPVRIRSPD